MLKLGSPLPSTFVAVSLPSGPLGCIGAVRQVMRCLYALPWVKLFSTKFAGVTCLPFSPTFYPKT